MGSDTQGTGSIDCGTLRDRQLTDHRRSNRYRDPGGKETPPGLLADHGGRGSPDRPDKRWCCARCLFDGTPKGRGSAAGGQGMTTPKDDKPAPNQSDSVITM